MDATFSLILKPASGAEMLNSLGNGAIIGADKLGMEGLIVVKPLRSGRAYLMRIIFVCFRVTMLQEMNLSMVSFTLNGWRPGLGFHCRAPK